MGWGSEPQVDKTGNRTGEERGEKRMGHMERLGMVMRW